MARLRDDVRKAFEREQIALGSVGDARHRLMQGALENRDVPASRGLQWAAGIAAVLIAAIVIATFAIARAGNHAHLVPAATPSPSTSPTPQASPTPLANQLSVPDSTPIIVFNDPANFDQLDGVTWDGKQSGKLATGASTGGTANWQGTYYQTMTGIHDRTGHIVEAPGSKGDVVYWADDGAHYCDVAHTRSADVSGPGMLQLGIPGQARRNVAQVGSFGSATSNAGGPVIVACSKAGDRAVVYEAGGQGVGVVEFWVIQISTGRTVWHGGSGAWIAASHDGAYVGLADSNGHTTIYGPNGSVAGTVASEVFAFSWDASLAVVAANIGASPSIVDWRTGQTIWTCPDTSFKLAQAFPEPGGSHFAIGVIDPAYPQTGGFATVDLFVVGSDGVVVFEKKDTTLFQY